jgi:hypothetical protein
VNDADRFRLLDKYRTPRCRIGQTVRCLVSGEVVIVALSDAPIPWPLCKAGPWLVPVVYRDLAKALRRESAQAIGHHWGAGIWSVWQWRKALGVRRTEGTFRLQHEHALEPGIAAGRAKAHEMSRDAGQDAARRQKIAASKRGKPRPAHIIEAMAKANRGRPLSEEHRRKLSEAQRRRGARPPKAGRPWTAEEDHLIRTLPAPEAAAKTGRPLGAVYDRRRKLKLPDGRAGRKIGRRP